MSRVILTGNPIWARDVNTTQYCGDPNKKDFGNVGVLNPKTDLGANQHARLVADLTTVARSSLLMRLVFTPNATAPSTSVQCCMPAWSPPATWLDGAVTRPGYPDGSAPPSQYYATIVGTGSTRTITLPTEASDDYGVTYAVTPRIVQAIGGAWNGTITSNAFTLTGLTAGKQVSVTIW